MDSFYAIVPLSQKYLAEATTLAHHVFPDEAKIPFTSPGLVFEISLDLHNPKYDAFWKQDRSDWLEYFVAIDNSTNKVIGTTGLYHQKGDGAGIVWLGWYCVDPAYRGKGIGKALLQFTIKRAREQKRAKLNLYTDAALKTAATVYDKFGFTTIKKEEREGWKVVYKQLVL